MDTVKAPLDRVVDYATASSLGFTPAMIATQLRNLAWQRLEPGVFLIGGTSGDEEAFLTQVRARIMRFAPYAVASHRSAAMLHELDDATMDHTEITVPPNQGCRSEGVYRSRTLVGGDVQMRKGIPVTNKARTLVDLARLLSVDELEVALESALRGTDPRRPDLWNEPLLADLERRSQQAQPGTATLRAVLSRRPNGTRPTGSAAETTLVQALRRAGLPDLTRQPTVRIVRRTGWRGSGRTIVELFPDLGDLGRGLLVETDGIEAHTGASALERDLARQNQLAGVFEILRFTGTQVFRDPVAVTERIAESLGRLSPTRLHQRSDVRFTEFGVDIIG